MNLLTSEEKLNNCLKQKSNTSKQDLRYPRKTKNLYILKQNNTYWFYLLWSFVIVEIDAEIATATQLSLGCYHHHSSTNTRLFHIPCNKESAPIYLSTCWVEHVRHISYSDTNTSAVRRLGEHVSFIPNTTTAVGAEAGLRTWEIAGVSQRERPQQRYGGDHLDPVPERNYYMANHPDTAVSRLHPPPITQCVPWVRPRGCCNRPLLSSMFSPRKARGAVFTQHSVRNPTQFCVYSIPHTHSR